MTELATEEKPAAEPQEAPAEPAPADETPNPRTNKDRALPAPTRGRSSAAFFHRKRRRKSRHGQRALLHLQGPCLPPESPQPRQGLHALRRKVPEARRDPERFFKLVDEDISGNADFTLGGFVRFYEAHAKKEG